MLALWEKNFDKPRQCIKKQRHHFADKGLYNEGCNEMVFPVVMYGFFMDHKELIFLNCDSGEDS